MVMVDGCDEMGWDGMEWSGNWGGRGGGGMAYKG